MKDIDMIIANRILHILTSQNKSQSQLAEGIGVSMQIMNKMLNGGQTIKAFELNMIAGFLNVPLKFIMHIPHQAIADPLQSLMSKVESKQAKEALQLADTLSDMILFHRRVRINGTAMIQPMKDDIC
jgi:transcriptional regulator with XRE-family HTH domain